MTKAEPINLSIIDDKEIRKNQEKQKKIQQVMDIIRENGLEKDKEFMDEINMLMEALLDEKE
ncbi:MAG: hypothetical protein WCJ45_08180 [bacterium]